MVLQHSLVGNPYFGIEWDFPPSYAVIHLLFHNFIDPYFIFTLTVI